MIMCVMLTFLLPPNVLDRLPTSCVERMAWYSHSSGLGLGHVSRMPPLVGVYLCGLLVGVYFTCWCTL